MNICRNETLVHCVTNTFSSLGSFVIWLWSLHYFEIFFLFNKSNVFFQPSLVWFSDFNQIQLVLILVKGGAGIPLFFPGGRIDWPPHTQSHQPPRWNHQLHVGLFLGCLFRGQYCNPHLWQLVPCLAIWQLRPFYLLFLFRIFLIVFVHMFLHKTAYLVLNLNFLTGEFRENWLKNCIKLSFPKIEYSF